MKKTILFLVILLLSALGTKAFAHCPANDYFGGYTMYNEGLIPAPKALQTEDIELYINEYLPGLDKAITVNGSIRSCIDELKWRLSPEQLVLLFSNLQKIPTFSPHKRLSIKSITEKWVPTYLDYNYRKISAENVILVSKVLKSKLKRNEMIETFIKNRFDPRHNNYTDITLNKEELMDLTDNLYDFKWWKSKNGDHFDKENVMERIMIITMSN
jgi:hypothetical protein